MAGHSKWANIRHRKEKQDAAKGKIFTKIIREITLAARQGEDPDSNSKLKIIIDKALSYNMSRDTIDRAIKRGSSDLKDIHLVEIFYEGYAIGGIAILVRCLTDNRNRTAGEIRYIFTKHGGNLGTVGSVAYIFKSSGIISFSKKNDEEKLIQLSIDSGAQDIIYNENEIKIITIPEDYYKIKNILEKNELISIKSEISMLPLKTINVDYNHSLLILELISDLEMLDDVQNVYSNELIINE